MSKNLVEEIKKYKGWKKGKKYIAAKLNITPEDVDKLVEIRDVEEDSEVEETVNVDNGDKTVKYYSDKAPTKEDIEREYGIDGITLRLSNYWNKRQANGKYLVSAHIKCLINDFYSPDELKTKLKELFPNTLKAFTLPEAKAPQAKLLTIVLSDDHAGMINTTNIYKAEDFTQETYSNRLLKLVTEAKKLGVFEEVRVISLGDQLQGWNKQTTRGGHEVNATSNKDQFDFYVKARIAFYNTLFSSGIGAKYTVDEIDTSNHAGAGFSYMANAYLGMYLQAKFPQVELKQYLSAIDAIQFGNHIIILTHGKEEKFQKRPLPYNIDDKTDLFVYDWASTMGVNPTEYNITLYKGDLHKFGLQMGKFGRYVNIPSISGRSDYSDINYGNSRPGALLEVYEKDSDSIISKPIWF